MTFKDETQYKCPSCGDVFTAATWNKSTEESFGASITEIELKKSNLLFCCPNCTAESADATIERIDVTTEFPVAVTISYTIYPKSVDEDSAMRIAKSMDAEDLISEIPENPTIEFENVEE